MLVKQKTETSYNYNVVNIMNYAFNSIRSTYSECVSFANGRFAAIFIATCIGLSACVVGPPVSSNIECDSDKGDTREIPCGESGTGKLTQVCRDYQWTDKGFCEGGQCTNGTSRTDDCGYNFNGSVKRQCRDGVWTIQNIDLDAACEDSDDYEACVCNDPDECKNGDTSGTVACGPGDSGTQAAVCVSGRWVAQDEDGPCEESWDCVEDGELGEVACGFNGRGTRDAQCEDHRWIAVSDADDSAACDDPDRCKDGEMGRLVACGDNQEGVISTSCVEGQWQEISDEDECDTAYTCQAGDNRYVSRACGLNDRGDLLESCEDGVWTDADNTCDDPDTCVDGESGTVSGCGLGQSGFQDATCVQGQWDANQEAPCQGAWACLDDDTEIRACGKNGNGELPYLCVAHIWQENGDCYDPDLCTKGETKSAQCVDGEDTNGNPFVTTRECVQNTEDGTWYWGNWSDCESATECDFEDTEVLVCGADDHKHGVQDATCEAIDSEVEGRWVYSACYETATHLFSAPYGRMIRVQKGDFHTFGDNRNNTIPVQDFTEAYASYPLPALKSVPDVTDGAGRATERFSASETHQCAISGQTGRIACWGRNTEGELGTPSSAGSNIPQPVALSQNAVAVSVGKGFSCAITQDNDVYCWGKNDRGQLGRDTNGASSPTPTKVMSNVAMIAAGDAHVCAVKRVAKATDEVWCWGDNRQSQVIIGGAQSIQTPTKSTDISNNPGTTQSAPVSSGYDTCSKGGLMGLRTMCKNPCQNEVSQSIGSIAAGAQHTLVVWNTVIRATKGKVKKDGVLGDGLCQVVNDSMVSHTNLLGIGSNNENQMADASNMNVIIDTVNTPIKQYQAYARGNNSCVVSRIDDNAPRTLRCAGENNEKMLSEQSGKVKTLTAPAASLLLDQPLQDIALGVDSLCVLLKNGRIRCHGGNAYGQLGTGGTDADTNRGYVVNESTIP